MDIDIINIKPYSRDVFYYETDNMQIVHHSNYIRWMEEARLDWMKQIDWDYKKIEDDGIIIPVVSVGAEYKTMSHYGDTIQITVKVSKYTGVRLELEYDICDKNTGELRCLGNSSHCLLDANGNILFVKKVYPEKDKLLKEMAAMSKTK